MLAFPYVAEMALRHFLAAMVLGALATSLAHAQDAAPFRAATIYTVKQQGGGLGIFVDQIVIFQQVSYRSEKVWVAERRRHDQRLGKRTFQHDWIDGRTCPQLADVLAGIGRLPPARFAGPADKDGGWISDSAYVTLIGPAAGSRWGTALMQRDLGGDLSKWWWEAEKSLGSCWQDRIVIVGDGSVLPKLDTDDAAVAAGRP